jgi:hypothetical protein
MICALACVFGFQNRRMEGDHKSTIHFMVNKRQNHNVKGGNGGQSDTEVGRPARWGQRSVSAFPARHRPVPDMDDGGSVVRRDWGGQPPTSRKATGRKTKNLVGWGGACFVVAETPPVDGTCCLTSAWVQKMTRNLINFLSAC